MLKHCILTLEVKLVGFGSHLYTILTSTILPTRLVQRLISEVQYLRQQLEQTNERDREQRWIIAALTSRVPDLPADTEEPTRATPLDPCYPNPIR